MKKILAILLMGIFLNGCQSPPRSFHGTQLSPQFVYEEIAGKMYIDPEKSFCRAREYEVSEDYIGPRGLVIALPFEQCDLAVGFKPETYVSFVNFLQYVRALINGNQSPRIAR